jgi:hypothetical protein
VPSILIADSLLKLNAFESTGSVGIKVCGPYVTWPLFRIGHPYSRGNQITIYMDTHIWQALLLRMATKITCVTMRSDYVLKIHISDTSLGMYNG